MLVSTACGLFAPVVLKHVIEALSMVEIDMNGLSLWVSLLRLAKAMRRSLESGAVGGGVGGEGAVALLAAGLQLSSDTRRTVENRNGLSIYATFPSHFSSGLCGEDVQLAGGVVVAVAITVTEITATAAIMTRGALA
ncbi:hypothetical protein PC119_g22154 [Phytophthora cactorum]|uniref:Uncharacterized protein n=1 Tax=Phytophthora cactorum TaxID=29920 RepID=A0A8T1BD62_9STRA|nr:hypothetical protein PC117_g22394 [Phytophthora cactorum]KAG2976525.1 hypothetical protein PC119_g22154 [Phytophthora cactorum]